jgi:hypothetical protein
MSEDLRNSLKLWAGGIAVVGIIWAAARLDQLTGFMNHEAFIWFCLVTAPLTIWSMGQVGWGLWQRRASNPDNPNRR